MKKYILILAGFSFIFYSCRKEVVIENKKIEEYKEPTSKIVGKWKVEEREGLKQEDDYLIFTGNHGYAYSLETDDNGFREVNSFVSRADDQTVSIGGLLVAYSFDGDTLLLKYNPSNIIFKLSKTTDPNVDETKWLSTITTQKIVKAPENTYRLSFGVDGDILYFSARPFSLYNMYKFNSSNDVLQDSVNVIGSHSSYYKASSNELIIHAAGSSDKMKKTVNFNSASTFVDASTNSIGSISSISYNGNSGTFYAQSSYGKLYTGTLGGAFTELVDLDPFNIDNLIYIGNDEFYTVDNGNIYKVKISPGLQVLKAYRSVDGFSVKSLGYDGTNLWAYGELNNDEQFRKITLN